MITAVAASECFAQRVLNVRRCDDFAITGKGNNINWSKADWNTMTQLDSGATHYKTRFKIMYSASGIYVLFDGVDQKVTTKDYKDFESIFNGDVYEVFFHPDPKIRVYYEYEVNPLGKELILAISNLGDKAFQPWIPRRSMVKKAVSVDGSPGIGAAIRGWAAEIFFPFETLAILPNVPPVSGAEWRANFCRLDYDEGKMIKWSFSPGIKKSFHELDAFYSIKFE